MRSPEFYQGHLDAVSRSFALCIPQLAAPFRQHVALSYLLLRVLDTVEDADRVFVPDRRAIVASLLADADGALSYLTSLPQSDRGYRIFCAWSLMLGAATLGQVDGPRQSRRAETMELLGHIADIAQDD